MGMLWALLSGGEPLLRPDFLDIYMYLKKRGVLISVFTNATLLNEKTAKMFKEFPPRALEITVYGSKKEIYEKITQVPGSYGKFINGLNILDKYNISYTLKAMVMKSNYDDLDNIIKFAKSRKCFFDGSIKGFRFDGQLNLRSRKNTKWPKSKKDIDLEYQAILKEEEKRNRIIKEERLDIDTLISLDEKYPIRKEALEKFCEKFYFASNNDLLFNCGAGLQSFHIDCNGDFQLCMMLEYPFYKLVRENIKDKDKKRDIRERIDYAWNKFVPKVRNMKVSNDYECNKCKLRNLCGNCAAYSIIELGKYCAKPEYYCEIAHKKAEMLGLEKAKSK